MVIVTKAIKSEIQIKKITELLIELNIDFNNIEHYILAFIHRSIVNEKPDYAPEHNERLEFLGDAVLELIVTENLFKEFPEKKEGELTDIRSAIVRGKNLSKIARKLNFAEYLLLGKGEEKSGGRNNDYLLANVVESVLGAIFIDLGIEKAREFIDIHIYPTIKEILENNLTKDFKTSFQEFAQSEFEKTPVYKVLSEEGLDHDKTFEVGVYIGDNLAGTGKGSSKKKAQEDAAQNAFNKLNQK